MRKLFFAGCFLTYFTFNTKASDTLIKRASLHFQFAQNVGKAVANQPTFPKVKTLFISELSVARQCIGNERWHQEYNFPESALNIMYGTLGNKEVLGDVFAIFPSLNFEKKSSSRLIFQKKIGFGFAYFNRPYNLQNNSSNIVIGSTVTAVASLVLAASYQLSEFINLQAGGAYYHFSNAHYQLPNLGLNSLSFRLGISYYPTKKQSNFVKQEAINYVKKFKLNLKIGMGINERGGTFGPSNGPKYPIYLASVFASKRYSAKGIFQIGVEGNYNTGAYDYIVSNEVFSSQQKLKSTTSLFFLGHEYLWKHLSFVLQGGVFMHNPLYRELLSQQRTITFKQHLKSLFTTKFGFQYYLKNTYSKFSNQLYIGSYVKANLGQADYWENSIGFCF